VLVEGPRAVAAALDSGARFRFVAATPEALRREARVARRLGDAGVEVVPASASELEDHSDTESPQGVLGVTEEPRPALPGTARGERILVLDAVQDPGNVGTLVRGAAAFGAGRVLALNGTADPWGPKAVRASAGHVFGVSVHRVQASEGLAWLRDRGVPLLVADAAGSDVRTHPGPRDPAGGFALLVGNEARGPRPLAREHADAVVALPLAPRVESLNAAVAGCVLLWALGPGAHGNPNPHPTGVNH
jgi:RNA methyltransferase, TrmH family